LNDDGIARRQSTETEYAAARFKLIAACVVHGANVEFFG
jgi:hypothetical protein